MNRSHLFLRRTPLLLASILIGAGVAGAADQTDLTEIEQLKAALAAQQKELQALEATIDQQQLLLQKAIAASTAVVAPANLGNVASLTPVVPAPAPAPSASTLPAFPKPQPQAPASSGGNPCEANLGGEAPPYLRVGNTCITPVGFMDLTAFWRDKNAASGIGTNFGSVPYNNSIPAAKLSEFRFSPQNSRIGFRAEGDWKGAHFMGYNEFDFLGTSGGFNLGVTNGGFVPRLRLFWVDVRKGQWEFLAGQSWSMLTPNRTGISALPGDLFYSQVIDVNYLSGLTWTRQPGMRVLYHPNKKFTAGLSFENPNQYIGGSGGVSGTADTLPAAPALAGLGGTQVDNATNVLNTPNLHPDIIGKIAYDYSSRFHLELAGIERTFKIYDSATNSYSTVAGGGISFGINVAILKNVRLLNTDFWSDGGGRYLFGEVPDFIVRANGQVSPIHAGGTTNGFEATVKNTLFYGYYGAIYAGRNTAFDANGTTHIGYGYTGSSNADNRTMQEITFGFNQTIWKSPRYGAINYMMQYQWQFRNPWFTALGAPKGTHDNAIYANVRYTLPGGAPNF